METYRRDYILPPDDTEYLNNCCYFGRNMENVLPFPGTEATLI